MKNILFAFLFSCISPLFSQWIEEDDHVLGLKGGYEKNGYFGQVFYHYYVDRSQFLAFEGGVNFEKYQLDEFKIPVQLYLANGTYNYKILDLARYDQLLLFVGAGFVGGYEQINHGKERINIGEKITPQSKFIYGGIGSLTLRWNLSETGANRYHDLFIMVGANYHYFINSDLKNRMPNVSIGLGIRL